MHLKIQKETIFIIIAVIVAIGALTGVAYLILDDGSPRVKVVPAVSSDAVPAEPDSSEGAYIPEIAGEWFRTGVSQEAPATLEISEVTETGFKFQLHARNMTKSGSIGGEASFNGIQEATFVNSDTGASIIFAIADYTITVSHTSTDTDLGCDDTVTYDGTYSMDSPVYTDVSSDTSSVASQSAVELNLTKDLRKDSTIVNNIKKLMSASDYNLYKNIMTDENIRDNYPQAEVQTDKNGNQIWVDSELNAVKYYAVLSGASTEILLMCKPDGKVYVAVYEVDEVRYYSNDSDYTKKAPNSVTLFAESRPAPIKYMS